MSAPPVVAATPAMEDSLIAIYRLRESGALGTGIHVAALEMPEQTA